MEDRMTELLTIRDARSTDVDRLYEMGVIEDGFALSPRTRFYPKEYLMRWLEDPKDDVLLVVEKGADTVGFLFCRVFRDSWAILDNIFVTQSYRRQRIGTRLLKECLDRLQTKGIKYIAGIAKEKNKSIDFFLKGGFLKGNTFVWIEKFL